MGAGRGTWEGCGFSGSPCPSSLLRKPPWCCSDRSQQPGRQRGERSDTHTIFFLSEARAQPEQHLSKVLPPQHGAARLSPML